MKKLISFLCFILINAFLFAQDISVKHSKWYNTEYNGRVNHEVHNHKGYSLCFLQETMCPEYVIWTISSSEAIEAEQNSNRTNDFRPCGNSAKLSDYYKTGFDRGHMCPNNDMDFSVEYASDTFRLCNMCPQLPQFNRGVWKKLETKDHEYAKKYGKVDIICGPIYSNATNSKVYIGKNNIQVPDAFFRVYYNRDSKFLECYILYQTDKDIPDCVDIDLVEAATGLKFIY